MPSKHDFDQVQINEADGTVDRFFAQRSPSQTGAEDLPDYLRELAGFLENKAEWLMADAETYRKAADAVAANNARVAIYKIETIALRAKLAALTSKVS